MNLETQKCTAHYVSNLFPSFYSIPNPTFISSRNLSLVACILFTHLRFHASICSCSQHLVHAKCFLCQSILINSLYILTNINNFHPKFRVQTHNSPNIGYINKQRLPNLNVYNVYTRRKRFSEKNICK